MLQIVGWGGRGGRGGEGRVELSFQCLRPSASLRAAGKKKKNNNNKVKSKPLELRSRVKSLFDSLDMLELVEL
jgi:hypothetical protein